MGAKSHGENTPHSLLAGRTGKLAFPFHRIPLVTLGNLFVMLLLGAAAAWWWRAHGVRERALLLAKQHCAKQGVGCSTRMSRADACVWPAIIAGNGG